MGPKAWSCPWCCPGERLSMGGGRLCPTGPSPGFRGPADLLPWQPNGRETGTEVRELCAGATAAWACDCGISCWAGLGKGHVADRDTQSSSAEGPREPTRE